MFHLMLHLIIPLIVSLAFHKYLYTVNHFKLNFIHTRWLAAWIIMLITMLVDIDHLLASPIYQINRCSIGFHPLHTFLPISFYLIACIPQKTRVIGAGLVIHMILDSIDCRVNLGVWYV